MKELLELLNSYAPMSPGLQAHLASILKTRKFKKGAHILREGETCQYIYFIQSGLVRISYLLKEEEVTSWLLKEGDIVISVRSFFKQKPSYEDILALEDSILLGITYKELNDACRKYPEMCLIRIFITEDYYVRSEDKHHDDRRQTSYDKYVRLMESAPELIQRVPLKYIYSYLGVSKATFERIRAKYVSDQKKQRRR